MERSHLLSPMTRGCLVALALACLAAGVYYPALALRTSPEDRWVWDDWSLLRTPAMFRADGLGDFWHYPPRNSLEEHYWPLTYTLFWLQARLWGLDAFWFRLTNIVFHVANTIMAWQLLKRIRVAGAALGAAVFAVHPVHVESVAWIIELKDVLSAFFYFSAALAYVSFSNHEQRDSRRRYAMFGVSLLCYVAAVWSKSIAITFPFAAILYEWWQGGWPRLRQQRGILVLLGVACALVFLDLNLAMRAGRQPSHFPLSHRLQLFGYAFWFYIGKLLIPYPLQFIYPKWALGTHGVWDWIPLLAFLVVTCVLLFARRRLGSGILAASGFYWVTLLPTLGLIPFSFMQYAYVADRFQYLASFAPCALFGAFAARMVSDLRQLPLRIAVGILVGLVIATFTALTAQRAALFGSAERILRETVQLNPNAWIAHQVLGTIRVRVEDYTSARRHFEQALQTCPNDATLHANLAFVLYQEGQWTQAFREAETAMRLDPNSAWAWAVRGASRAKLGDTQGAVKDLEMALKHDPDHRFARSIFGGLSGATIPSLEKGDDGASTPQRRNNPRVSDTPSTRPLASNAAQSL